MRTPVDIGPCVREDAELQRGWTLGSALGRTLSLERGGLWDLTWIGERNETFFIIVSLDCYRFHYSRENGLLLHIHWAMYVVIDRQKNHKKKKKKLMQKRCSVESRFTCLHNESGLLWELCRRKNTTIIGIWNLNFKWAVLHMCESTKCINFINGTL